MKYYPATLLLASFLLASCGAGKTGGNDPDPYALKAVETMDSVYARYGTDSTNLLRENYPPDEQYRATYLASDDDAARPNPYSYLWPYSGTLSAMAAIYEATGDSSYLQVIDEKVVPGLEHYFDATRTPPAYASYINSAPPSDRFYDDNVWLGIDFTDLYLASGRPGYLDKAKLIWNFIESGTDSILGGGIYWCEQKKHSKNTCSNAPGAVYALKLFQATKNNDFLDKGKALYHWTKNTLQDTTDCLYFDNINLSGNIGKAKYAYNSGQMLQAASLLYQITGDKAYFTDARQIARSAYDYFFNGGTATDTEGDLRLLNKGDIWFTAVMLRGFAQLYGIDHNPEYMEAFRRNLDYAWQHSREASSGLFNTDWSGNESDAKKWLLTQAAMGEMFARIASYSSNKNE